jgi:putative transposase
VNGRRRPTRLEAFPYRGCYRYSVTTCTAARVPVFSSESVVSAVLAGLRRLAAAHGFVVVAYCFMPDHVHLLLEGAGDHAHLPALISRWKQSTGYWYRQQSCGALWQEGYYERVIRSDEASLEVAAYIVSNPVRGRLCRSVLDYPYSGSDVFSMAQIAEALQCGQWYGG